MTITELSERQNWTISQKIDHTCGAIEAMYAYCAKHGFIPYVSFSGGLNSTVLLDLVRRYIDPGIKGVFCSTGNEYPDIIRFVKQTENVDIIHPQMTPREVVLQYGFPLVSKDQAMAVRQIRTTRSSKLRTYRLQGEGLRRVGVLSAKWRYLIDEPYMVSEKCCEILKKRPFHKYNRRTRSLGMVGTMASESRTRIINYVRQGGCNVFAQDPLKTHSAPISIWTNEDCWNYVRRFDVPYCEIYDVEGVHRTGCMFCGFGAQFPADHRFDILNARHPKVYSAAMDYTNNGCTYRCALQRMGVQLPDRQAEPSLTNTK